MTNVSQAVILGLIQGLTEFIPVSSSGHLHLIPALVGWEQPSTVFILFLHIGTLAALIIYFRAKLYRYLMVLLASVGLAKVQNRHEYRAQLGVIAKILLATIPAGLIGLILEERITAFYTETGGELNISALLTAAAMAIVGSIFLISHRLFTGKKHGMEEMSYPQSLIIGFSQALALIRGVSRSGITLLAGQAIGMSRVAAAEFSFLMSIPIIGATSVYGIYQLLQLPQDQITSELQIALIGLAVSFVSGWAAIRFMLQYLQHNNLTAFGWYRIVFALAAIFILLSNV